MQPRNHSWLLRFFVPAATTNLLLLLGCASADKKYDADGYPCPHWESIQILYERPSDCKDVGIVADHDYAGDLPDLLNGLKQQAAELCADAVVVDKKDLDEFRSNLTGMAIKY
jgi:hypothetical protein